VNQAKKYAYKHVNDTYSRTYGYYDGVGGDCANFVSQVLEHGGYKRTRTWKPVKNNWVNANGIYSNIKHHKNGFNGTLIAKIQIKGNKLVALKGSLDDVKRGDIGFKMYDRPYRGSYYGGINNMHYTSHVIFISSAKSAQNIKYTAHSPARKNKRISTNSDFKYTSSYKKRIVEIWRPQGKDTTQTEETTQNNTPSIYYQSGELEFNKWLKGRLRGKVNNADKEYAELLHHRKSTMRLYAIDESFEENTKINIFMYSKSAKKPLIYVYHKDKNGKRKTDAKGRRYKNGRYNVSALSVTLKPGVKYFVEATTNKLEKNVKYYLYMSE